MSILQYPKIQYHLVANDTVTNLGSIDLPADGNLRTMTIRVHNRKVGAYTYLMKLRIATREGGYVLAESDQEIFSDSVTGQLTSDWLGNLTFTFNHYPISAALPVHVSLEMSGYARPATPNQDTEYLGVWCDWLEPIGNSNTAAARMILGVER